MTHAFSPHDIAQRFVLWDQRAHWTPHGVVFDMGISTSQALRRAAAGTPPLECGGRDEQDNGNGSLMRILPVCLRFAVAETDTLVRRIEEASSITHAHRRSLMACVMYGLVVRALLQGTSAAESVRMAQREFRALSGPCWADEVKIFKIALDPELAKLPELEISSAGYVMHTLEASLWCLLTTDNFSDCVLKAVNLGGDTDTTGCVAGGLAGVCYGLEAIPSEWRAALARTAEVEVLFNQFLALIP